MLSQPGRELGLDDGQLARIDVEQLAQRRHPQRTRPLEGHLIQQRLAAGPEHVIEGGQDPFLGHHRVDLGLGPTCAAP
jgi:hypothetical protein